MLTTAPLTIADYRRLLLRIEGLRNAWLDPMTDPDRARQLSALGGADLRRLSSPTRCRSRAVNAIGQNNHPVKLTGLYKVLVELEIDDVLGSLNESACSCSSRGAAL